MESKTTQLGKLDTSQSKPSDTKTNVLPLKIIYKNTLEYGSEGTTLRGTYLGKELISIEAVIMGSTSATQIDIFLKDNITILNYHVQNYPEAFSNKLVSVDTFTRFIVDKNVYENKMPNENLVTLDKEDRDNINKMITLFIQILNNNK